jgi:hypothetical protein
MQFARFENPPPHNHRRTAVLRKLATIRAEAKEVRDQIRPHRFRKVA